MKYKSVAVFFLLVYIRLLFKVLVFKDVPLIRVGGLMFDFGGTQAGEPNLLPFKTIVFKIVKINVQIAFDAISKVPHGSFLYSPNFY